MKQFTRNVILGSVGGLLPIIVLAILIDFDIIFIAPAFAPILGLFYAVVRWAWSE